MKSCAPLVPESRDCILWNKLPTRCAWNQNSRLCINLAIYRSLFEMIIVTIQAGTDPKGFVLKFTALSLIFDHFQGENPV